MKKLKISDISNRTLKEDHNLLKEVQAQCRKIKEEYKPEIAAKKMKPLIDGFAEKRAVTKSVVCNDLDKTLAEIKKSHINSNVSEGHQLALNNILKILELSKFNVSKEQLEGLINPLVVAGDNYSIGMISNILKANNSDMESPNYMSASENIEYLNGVSKCSEVQEISNIFDNIKAYLNTDPIVAIGGDKFHDHFSRLEEVYHNAQVEGYDITDLIQNEYNKELNVIDMEQYQKELIDFQLGNKVEEPIFPNAVDGDLQEIMDNMPQ